jgi:hypothetical protein
MGSLFIVLVYKPRNQEDREYLWHTIVLMEQKKHFVILNLNSTQSANNQNITNVKSNQFCLCGNEASVI